MDKDFAARLEGMVLGSRMTLQSVAEFVRDHAPEADRRAMLLKIGTAMSELLDISWMIYERHPSLDPYPEETRLAAAMRDTPQSEDGGV
jgi:hypothetical protein